MTLGRRSLTPSMGRHKACPNYLSARMEKV